MAIVVNPALSMAASGNMGAICYARWRGGAVAKARTTYTFVPNPLQASRNAVLVAVSQAWGTLLSQSERVLWQDVAMSVPAYDRFGRAYTCTGFQLFMRLNTQRGMIPLPILTAPPRLGSAFLIVGLTAVTNLITGLVDVTGTLMTGGGVPDLVQYWRTGPFDSPGRHALPQEFKFLNVQRPVATWASPGLLPGKYYWFRARAGMDTGEIGNWHELQFAA